MNDHCLVFCTCPNQNIAETIANKLVEQRLAACVNILPVVQSIYHWENKIVHDNEVMLIIKSMQHCFAELTQIIQSLHPYSIPEIISSPIQQGTALYLNWLSDNCKEA